VPDPEDDQLALAAVLRRPLVEPEEQPTSRAQLREQRQQHVRRRRRGGRRFVVLLLTVAIVGGASFGAFTVLKPMITQLTDSNDFTGAGAGTVKVTIPQGASGRTIGQVLEAAGVVKTGKAFADAAGKSPDAGSIQPGQYVLREKMSASDALTMLLDPAARQEGRVTVREGLRQSEVVALLAKETGNPVGAYAAALKDPGGIGLPAGANGKAEGWLFPDTYSFGPDIAPKQQLATMVARTNDVLDSLGVSASQARRVMTVASIVEVEASSPADYAKVAQVLRNRLADKLGNGGKLQLDSTVSYAVGRRSLTTTDAERAVDSRYNTYRYPGLPAGPISNPGKAAILGALEPTPGPWLFFVTVDPSTGETKFATTGAQHQANVRQFQAWCQAHRGKC
jgi:UPF0755 protein